MSDIPIDNMDFKQLRQKVQELNDIIARMKREYEDVLYNLDDDNFSAKIVKEKDGMKAEIKVSAQEIKTKVSETDLENALSKYSTISQTAEKISLAVNETKEYADEGFLTLSSNLTLTNNKISSMVQKNISASFSSNYHPNTLSNLTELQKTMLCEYDDVFYYYDDYNDTWIEYPADGLKTMFEQTADKFSLTGNVEIDGSLIVDESISASAIDTTNLSCERLYAKGYKTGYYAKMASSWGDFGIYTPNAEDSASPLSGNCIWGVYYSDPGTRVVNFYSQGNNYMGFNGTQNKTFPKGTWDFSSATVLGLSASSVVAVFG